MMRATILKATFALSLLGGGLLFSQITTDDDGGIFDQKLIANNEQPVTVEGVEPQGKGPVHEAFASPSVAVPQAGTIVAKAVPQPIEEMPPEQKPDGENVQWISGYWYFDQDSNDYMWISGIWRQIPPAMEWVPGTWNAVTGGSQYSPGFWRAEQHGENDMAIVPTPPEPLVTADPPAPDDSSTYVPGSWVYRETRYVWRPACWVPFRPGWVWVPARYIATGCGYIFVDGYWDYPVRERGLLFAPVVISRNFYSRPGFIYRPSYVVHDQCLLSCLFVNSRYGVYNFGDYYDPRFANRGYVAWSSYRVNRTHPDPLFSHYRYVHRQNPTWERNLLALQNARLRNEAPRPPVNFNVQANLIKQNAGHTHQLGLLAPINKVNTKVMPLVQMGKVKSVEQQLLIRKQVEASHKRSQLEMNLAKSAPPMLGEKVRPITIHTPKTNVVLSQEKIKTIPPPPAGHKSPVFNTGKTTTVNNPPIGGDKKPPVVVGNPNDKKPPVVVGNPNDKKPPVIVGNPNDKKPPVVVGNPNDKKPPVVVNPPVNPPKVNPPPVNPPKVNPPPVNPPKVNPPPVNPPKVNPPVNPPKVNPPPVNPPKVNPPPVNPPKVNPPVNPPKVNPPPVNPPKVNPTVNPPKVNPPPANPPKTETKNPPPKTDGKNPQPKNGARLHSPGHDAARHSEKRVESKALQVRAIERIPTGLRRSLA